MTWFKVDDGFSEDPKFESLEAMGPQKLQAAVTVWCVMGADCARRLTDGVVTRDRLLKVLRVLGKSALIGAQALVDARDPLGGSQVGYWVEIPGGWRFHKWEKYQPTRALIEAERESKKQRQQRWRAASGDKHRDAPVDASTQPSHNPSTKPPSDVATDATNDAAEDALVTHAHARASPVPTRPVPTNSPISPHGGLDAVELEPGEPEPSEVDRKRTHQLVREGFTRRFEKATGNPPSWTADNVRLAAAVARWLDQLPDTVPALNRLLDGFFADSWAGEHTYPIGALAKNPQRYLQATSGEKSDLVFRKARELLRKGNKEQGLELMKRGAELADREAANAARLG